MKKKNFEKQEKNMSDNTFKSSRQNTLSEKKTQRVFVLPPTYSQILSKEEVHKFDSLTNEQLATFMADGDNTAAIYLVFYRFPNVIECVANKYLSYAGYDNISDFRSDIVSSIFENLTLGKWQKKLAYADDMGGYLYKCIKNEVTSRTKKKMKYENTTTKLSDDYDIADESNSFVEQENQEYYKQKLTLLMDKANINSLDREILMRRFGHNESAKEVAIALTPMFEAKGLTGNREDYVNNRSKRALDKLRNVA